MNQMEVFHRLARIAEQDTPPPIDVTAAVMRRLAAPPPALDWPLAVFATGSAIAAGIILVFATGVWQAHTDPFAEMFRSLEVVLP